MTLYLDNAATSFPKPPAVYEQMIQALQTAGANPGRAGHRLARAAQQIIEETRFQLARFINAAAPEQVIFTFNATDALNIALKGLLNAGDHVISTKLEHNSVLRPLRGLMQTGVEVTLVDFSPAGFINPQDIEAAITNKTRLIAITSASNVLGTVQPIEAVAEIAHRHNLLMLVDGAQTVGISEMDVQALKIDLLVASGHKALLGPPGTGFLYVGERVELKSFREGGTGGDSLGIYQPTEMPVHLEAGTHNLSGIAGLKAALQYLTTHWTTIKSLEKSLTEQLLADLQVLENITLYGSTDLARHVGVAAFSVKGYRAEEVAAVLDQHFDIAVRAGLHCAPLVHETLGTLPDGLVRVSIGPFNTAKDIDTLINALAEMGGY